MNIVVLLKAVPVVGTERLDSDLLTDRSVQLEANGNDEYLLEKALKLTEAHGGEVTRADGGPAGATEPLARHWRWAPRAPSTSLTTRSKGSDIRATLEVLAAALRKLEFDLLFVGADTSDGQGGVVGAGGRGQPRPALPVIRVRDRADRCAACRIHRITTTGYDVLEAPTPAVVMGTQLLGRAALPVAARHHAGALQADRARGRSAILGSSRGDRSAARPTTKTLDADQAARARRSDVRARGARRRRGADRRLPGRAEAHLMATIWAIGELADGAPNQADARARHARAQLAEAAGGERRSRAGWRGRQRTPAATSRSTARRPRRRRRTIAQRPAGQRRPLRRASRR